MEQSSAPAAIRRKPLRASMTIGNSRTSPADFGAQLESSPSEEIQLDAAAFDCYVDTRKYIIDPELRPAPKIVLEPVDTNTNPPVRATRSLPNLLLATAPHPKTEDSGLQLPDPASFSLATSLQSESTRRLSKPPRVHVRSQRSGKKLQKRPKKGISHHPEIPHVFLLQYEQYPYNVQPGTLLGVFSTFQSVSAGAISHGAYAFSKEGMHDGTEYLTKTGRIKIIPTPIQNVESKTRLPTARRQNMTPPTARSPTAPVPSPGPSALPPPPEHIPIDGKAGILVAVHQSPNSISCLGAFTNRRAAWATCKKEGASLLGKEQIRGSDRWLDGFEMPHLKVREAGKGWHEWYVVVHRIDDAIVSSS